MKHESEPFRLTAEQQARLDEQVAALTAQHRTGYFVDLGVATVAAVGAWWFLATAVRWGVRRG